MVRGLRLGGSGKAGRQGRRWRVWGKKKGFVDCALQVRHIE